MNLFDSSFLVLDIGTNTVRAVAHRIKSGKIAKSAISAVTGSDTEFALKSAVDDVEKQLGVRFDSAYVTGNFGAAKFEMTAQETVWNLEHKISEGDIRAQLNGIHTPDGAYAMHIIPLRYDTDCARNLSTPVGQMARRLISVFGALFYDDGMLKTRIFPALRAAHLDIELISDPSYVIAGGYREQKHASIFIDLGDSFSTISIWTQRGPVFFEKIPRGQNEITTAICKKLKLEISEAIRLKHATSFYSLVEMDRFTPIDTTYDFSRADLFDIASPVLRQIIGELKSLSDAATQKYAPDKIYIFGGGSEVNGIDETLSDIFDIPVKNLGADAVVQTLSDSVWDSFAPRIRAFERRQTKWKNFLSNIKPKTLNIKHKRKAFIPIMPSSLAFDMKNPMTYEMFRAGDISMIHIDIMDGFFVNRIVGGIEELKFIRKNTNAHLHVHLMTESPTTWAAAAANAGADTIIVSTNTAGVRNALHDIKHAGKRCGIALNPESNVAILKPVLKEIDEVLIMAVSPGAGGQTFDTDVLNKIKVLNGTRKKYGLKFKISVDGGINPDTAKLCWAAGADFLVSGSYLARANDFPLAVQSLIHNS